jgi:hypothetical protein
VSRSKPYPRICYKGKIYKISRLIYEEFTGIAPGDLWVLHKCDNPGCINPNHLYLGTARDNRKDLKDRGKSPYPSSHNPLYKLRKRVSARDYWENSPATQGHQAQNEASKELNLQG